MKSAIIIGASSGIGRALAVTLSRDGYRVGVVARRTDLLTSLPAELPGPCGIKTVDVSQPELAMPLVRELIDELGDVELFIVSAGTGFENCSGWPLRTRQPGRFAQRFTGGGNACTC
jgi:short-subunit dehydrogenase